MALYLRATLANPVNSGPLKRQILANISFACPRNLKLFFQRFRKRMWFTFVYYFNKPPNEKNDGFRPGICLRDVYDLCGIWCDITQSGADRNVFDFCRFNDSYRTCDGSGQSFENTAIHVRQSGILIKRFLNPITYTSSPPIGGLFLCLISSHLDVDVFKILGQVVVSSKTDPDDGLRFQIEIQFNELTVNAV